jgi:hypothetical protein
MLFWLAITCTVPRSVLNYLFILKAVLFHASPHGQLMPDIHSLSGCASIQNVFGIVNNLLEVIRLRGFKKGRGVPV